MLGAWKFTLENVYRPFPDDSAMYTPIINLPGLLTAASIYGQTRIPAASLLERLQVALESAPVGGDVTLSLVDAAGAAYGVSVTVPAGQTFGEFVFNPAGRLALAAGSDLRAKCIATPGGDYPGGFGVLTLFTRLAN